MKKRIALIALAAAMVFALMACSVKTETKVETSTETVTETVTETTGTTSVSTTVEQADDKEAPQSGTQIGVKAVEGAGTKAAAAPTKAAQGEVTEATIIFRNKTGVDFYQLYFASSAADEWGDEWLGDAAPLDDGYRVTVEGRLKYAADDTSWDLLLADSEGETVQFAGIDLSLAKNPQEITIVLTFDETDASFCATIQ